MPQILQFAVKGGIFYIKTKKIFPMNNFKRKIVKNNGIRSNAA